MSKEDIVKQLRLECSNNDLDVKKSDLDKIYDVFMNIIKVDLKEKGLVRLHGIGTFSAVVSEEKQCRNPQSGEMMTVPKKTRVKFKASKTLVDLLNEKEQAGVN
jgi:DNA-binding protein HU-beta